MSAELVRFKLFNALHEFFKKCNVAWIFQISVVRIRLQCYMPHLFVEKCSRLVQRSGGVSLCVVAVWNSHTIGTSISELVTMEISQKNASQMQMV